MQTMSINGKEYKVIGEVESKLLRRNVPLVNLRLMTNEEEHRLAEQNAVENYRRTFGREPKDIQTAVQWQRQDIEETARKENLI